MPIKIGDTNITDIKIGNTAVNSVWIGANRVWSRELVVINGLLQTTGSFFGVGFTNSNRGYHGSMYDAGTATFSAMGSISRDDIKINGTYYDVEWCYWYEQEYESNANSWQSMRVLGFGVSGNVASTELSTLNIGNASFSPFDDNWHAYAQSGGVSYWIWRRAEANGESLSDLPSPFNSTAGTNYTVTDS